MYSPAWPHRQIKEILPNVIVKGSDYKEEEVVGADIIKKNSGEVKLIKLLEGKSTTDIINKTKIL